MFNEEQLKTLVHHLLFRMVVIMHNNRAMVGDLIDKYNIDPATARNADLKEVVTDAEYAVVEMASKHIGEAIFALTPALEYMANEDTFKEMKYQDWVPQAFDQLQKDSAIPAFCGCGRCDFAAKQA